MTDCYFSRKIGKVSVFGTDSQPQNGFPAREAGGGGGEVFY